MRKTFILLSTITLCLFSAFSEAYENYPNFDGCCPSSCDCDPISYGFYGEWLYLQPEGNNLYYGVEAVTINPALAIPTISPNWNILEVDPNYHSGFRIGGRAYFPNADVSVDLNWERLHARDSHSFTAPAGVDGIIVGPLFDIGPDAVFYSHARGQVTSHFDQVNLNVGKKFCFCNFSTNMYGGVSIARIRQTVSSRYATEDGTTSRTISSPSNFIGAGPQLGLEYDYRIWDNLFFNGSSVGSIFIGEMKNHTTFKSYTPMLAADGVASPNGQTISVPHRTQLVPSFEQKLGFSYCAEFESIRATLAAGYQWQFYVNAVQTVDMTAPQEFPLLQPITPDVGVYGAGFKRTISNYMLSGPYVRLEIDF